MRTHSMRAVICLVITCFFLVISGVLYLDPSYSRFITWKVPAALAIIFFVAASTRSRDPGDPPPKRIHVLAKILFLLCALYFGYSAYEYRKYGGAFALVSALFLILFASYCCTNGRGVRKNKNLSQWQVFYLPQQFLINSSLNCIKVPARRCSRASLHNIVKNLRL